MANALIDMAAFWLLFLLAAGAVFWAMDIMRVLARLTVARRATVALVVSPVIAAWVFSWVLRLLPGHSDSVYLTVLFGLFGLPSILLGLSLLRQQQPRRWTISVADLAMVAAILVLCWSVTGTLLHTPVMANDPLEYFSVARAIYETKALSGVYPLLDTGLSNGFYAPWTHPPGFALQIALGYLVQGSANHAGAAKFLDVYVLATLMALVYVWAGGRTRWRGPVGALFIPLTPLLFREVYEIHIDVVRIGVWTAAFLILPAWFRSLRLRDSIALGIVVGMAMFVHSIGLLFWALFLGLIIVMRSSRPGAMLVQSLVAAAVSLAVVLPDYLQNVALYGRVIGDSAPLWEIEELRLPEFVYEQRGLITVGDRLRNGVLVLFSAGYLGRAHLLALIAVILLVGQAVWRARWRPWPAIQRLCLPIDINVWSVAYLGFVGVLLLSAVAGIEIVIKNVRYLMTMAGLAPVLVVVIADRLLVAARRTSSWPLPRGRAVAGVAAILLAYALTQLATQNDRRQRAIFPGFDPVVERTALNAALQCSYGPFRIAGLINDAHDGSGEAVRVLTFRPAEAAFYASYPMMSYLDPALLPAYVAPGGAAALKSLREIGITHILQPPYVMGEIENTAFKDLLEAPSQYQKRLVELEREYGGYKLWRLAGISAPLLPAEETTPVAIAPGRPFELNLADLDRVATTPASRAVPTLCRTAPYVPVDVAGETVAEIGESTALYGLDKVAIDPERAYRMSFDIRVSGEAAASIEAGLATFNADGELETDPPGAHRYGVAVGLDLPPGEDWVTLSGVFVGTGNENFNQFRDGTRSAVPMLLIDHGDTDTITQVRNIRLAMLDEDEKRVAIRGMECGYGPITKIERSAGALRFARATDMPPPAFPPPALLHRAPKEPTRLVAGTPLVLDPGNPRHMSGEPSAFENSVDCGSTVGSLRDEDGMSIFEARQATALYGIEKVAIDPERTYRMRFDVRVTGEAAARVEAGLATFDADGELQTEPPGAHRYGVAVGHYAPPGEGWVTLSGVFTGTGNENFNQFRAGTKSAVPVVLLNYGETDTVTQVRNIRLEILEE